MKDYEYDVSIAVTFTVRAESVNEAARIIRSAPFEVRADHGSVKVADAASLESWDLMGVTKVEESE